MFYFDPRQDGDHLQSVFLFVELFATGRGYEIEIFIGPVRYQGAF
jgi:hypothetical protein